MANLRIRNLNDDTYQWLRMRAMQHGVSMEEEVRRILKQAVSAPERLGDLFLAHVGSANGVDLELPREPHEPMDLSQMDCAGSQRRVGNDERALRANRITLRSKRPLNL